MIRCSKNNFAFEKKLKCSSLITLSDLQAEWRHRHGVEEEEVVDGHVLLRDQLDGLLSGTASHLKGKSYNISADIIHMANILAI